MMRWTALAAVCLLGLPALQAQNLLPNPSFEEGTDQPLGWQAKEGTVRWESTGHSGKRCLAVTGDGRNSHYWSTPLPPLEPGATYRFSFWGKLAPGTSGGCTVSGPDYCNRDYLLDPTWRQYAYVFCVPPQRPTGVCRLGQWRVKGTVYFDEVELRRVLPVNREEGAIQLGDGEDVSGTRYTFKSNLGGPGSNYSRLLDTATAGFNSNRWCFSPGTEVIYRQQVAGVEQTAAKVTVQVGWYASGNCLVAGSRDKQVWTPLGELTGLGSRTFEVPDALLPAETLYVRLQSLGQGEKLADFAPGAFQVHQYGYEATLAREAGFIQGVSSYLDVTQDTGQLAVAVKSVGTLVPGENSLRLAVRSTQSGQVSLTARFAPGQETSRAAAVTANGTAELKLPYSVAEAGAHTLTLTARLDGKPVWQAVTHFFVPYLYSNDYGYALSSDAHADLWWCEGTHKIARTRAAPTQKAPVRLAACRNEFEPVQVVVRPRQDLRHVTASLSDFQGPGGAKIPAEAWTIKLVEYLNVTTPTDSSACAGWWPDPLPTFNGGDFMAGRNWPLWLTVKVPEQARPGIYRGTLKLKADGYGATDAVQVPVELQVFDFTMPAKPHLQTAWGFSFGMVSQYQNLKTPEEKRQVFDLCMQNFRDHRIAPYSFFQLDPIAVRVAGLNWSGGQVVEGEASAGTHSLRIVDASDKSAVSAAAGSSLPIEQGATYSFSWAVKTEQPGQTYQLTLRCYDASGKWFSGRNIDLSLVGSGQWERQEVLLKPERFPAGCTRLNLEARPVRWTEKGELTGTCWYDDFFFGKPEGPNLVRDPSLELGNTDVSVKIDWTAFDRAAKRYLDEFGFTSFRLPIEFLPWGRTPDFHKGRLGPFEQGTPEYSRLFKDYMMQLQTHLEQNGWLDKAYIYWFDEPEPGDYDFCKSTFQLLKESGPKITRMLTEQPEAAIAGAVDLWCPVTSCYDYKSCHERQKLGERIWWYVCCAPKAPLAGLFIDHGATDLRAWLWQTWQNDVQGCLIWQSTWWDSAGAPQRPQNPWTDPMAWTPEGGCWGNGDGRFIYPVNRDYPSDKRTYVEGPVDSIRWEMLREGLEDWEYLYLLREALKKVPAGSAQYALLLKVPPAISEDLQRFCREPKPLYAHRAKIAAALEKLQVDKLGVK